MIYLVIVTIEFNIIVGALLGLIISYAMGYMAVEEVNGKGTC